MVLSVFLGHNLLDLNSPSPWNKDWKLGTEMGKVSMLHFLYCLVNDSKTTKGKAFILSDIKIQMVLDLPAKFLVIHAK